MEEVRDKGALAALRTLVPRLRDAAGSESVAMFHERRGLDSALVTELGLGFALPPQAAAEAFSDYASGGTADGAPGNWWATDHRKITLLHSVEDDQVLSARARYVGTANIEARQKSLGPKGCPVAGPGMRCERIGAWVRGEAPAPKIIVVCEGEMDLKAVKTTLPKRGRIDAGGGGQLLRICHDVFGLHSLWAGGKVVSSIVRSHRALTADSCWQSRAGSRYPLAA